MDFKEYLNQERKSEETIRTYLNEVKQYLNFYLTAEPNPGIFKRNNILKYIDELKQKVTKKGTMIHPITINKKISALKSYSEYLHTNGEIDSVPLSKKDFVKYQKDSIYSPHIIQTQQVKNLIESIRMDGNELLAILTIVLANSGLRLNECLSLKFKNLDFKSKSIFVLGKGGKFRYVMMPKFLFLELKKYYDTDKYSKEDYLFPSRQGGHLTKSTVNKALKKYTEITPHQFRHYHCSRLVNDEKAGITLLQASYQLGHSSTNTTKKYTNISQKQMSDKVFKLGDE